MHPELLFGHRLDLVSLMTPPRDRLRTAADSRHYFVTGGLRESS
jgi:hypothetical protein